VAEVNGPDIKAENDFDNTKVKTVEKSATAQGKRLQYKFPAHSFTQLRTKLA
jgi:alpha-N-arabinofuranosidase